MKTLPILFKYEDIKDLYPNVESFYAFLDEGGFIVEVTCGEEVACCDEEQRHVEFEDKLTEPSRCFRMGDDHQNDGDALGNGDGGVAVYSHGCSNEPNHPRNFCHLVRKRFHSSSVRTTLFCLSRSNISSSSLVVSRLMISAFSSKSKRRLRASRFVLPTVQNRPSTIMIFE